MSEVIRLSDVNIQWIERFRACQIAEAKSRIDEGFESGKFDLENYKNMSIKELVNDMLLHAKVHTESYCRDLNIEV